MFYFTGVIVTVIIMALVCIGMEGQINDEDLGIIVVCGLIWPIVLALLILCVIMSVFEWIKEKYV